MAHIRSQPERIAASQRLVGLGQQSIGASADQVIPAWMNGEFEVVATTRVLSKPAQAGHGLVTGCIQEHPAPAMALFEQIVAAAVEQLAQLGRAGGLLQLKKGPGRAAVEGAKGWIRGALWGPFSWCWPWECQAPETLGAEGLESLLPQGGEPIIVEAGAGGNPARCSACLQNRFP
jgi:hypothetical protein